MPDAVRRLRAQIGAHKSWANTENRTARTAPAREASFRRFLDEVDPARQLSDDERARRAEHLHKAHMAALALKSVASRRKAAEARRRAVVLDEAADAAAIELGEEG